MLFGVLSFGLVGCDNGTTGGNGGGETGYKLTINVSPTNGGTVSRNPNTASYDEGTSVEVTVTAHSGFTFTGWSGAATGTANPVTVVMDGNKTLTATFTATGGGGGEKPSPGTNIAERYRAEEKNIYQGSGGLYHGTQFWNYYDVTVHANSITFYTNAPLFNPDITITGASTNGGADIYVDYENLGMLIATGRWDYVFEGNNIIGLLLDYTLTTNGTPTTIYRGLYLGDDAKVQAQGLSIGLFLENPINPDFIQTKAESGYGVSFTDSVL